MADVLVVDDEPGIRDFLEILLRRQGHRVRLARDAVEGIAKLRESPADLLLSDLRLPRGSGMDILAFASRHAPHCQVIMMTAFATTENAIEAMKLGAYDYVLKPFQVEELSVVIERALERKELKSENQRLKAALDARAAGHRLLGGSRAMKDVLDMVDKVAPTRTTVLLTGESGTGKELVARALHSRSPRAHEPFVPIHCGAIPDALIESELFGHVRGSFTGAHIDKPGLFEVAQSGTVFLDEVGELPLAMQVKLLRVLQERKVRRVGGLQDLEVECRVVAATNRNLEEEVAAARFREDLYFRLNVIQLRLPPLRERKEDIPLLAESFVTKFADEQQSPVRRIADDAMRQLVSWNWPGNIRELENAIERGVTLSSGDTLHADAFPAHLRQVCVPTETQPVAALPLAELPEAGLDLESTLDDIERHLLQLALTRSGGKKKRAAELLRLSFRSFRYRVAKLRIDTSSEDDDSDDSALRFG